MNYDHVERCVGPNKLFIGRYLCKVRASSSLKLASHWYPVLKNLEDVCVPAPGACCLGQPKGTGAVYASAVREAVCVCVRYMLGFSAGWTWEGECSSCAHGPGIEAPGLTAVLWAAAARQEECPGPDLLEVEATCKQPLMLCLCITMLSFQKWCCFFFPFQLLSFKVTKVLDLWRGRQLRTIFSVTSPFRFLYWRKK